MCMRKIGKEQEVNVFGHFVVGIRCQTAYIRKGMAMVIRLIWGSIAKYDKMVLMTSSENPVMEQGMNRRFEKDALFISPRWIPTEK